MFGRDRYRYSAVSSRLAVLEDKYVKATWFERISSGTSGSLSLPTEADVVLNEWRAGIDAITTTLDPISETGYPAFTSAKEADGTLITATLDSAGNWTISGTPSAYPIGIIYVYRVKFQYFDDTKSLGEVELTTGYQTQGDVLDDLNTLGVAASDGQFIVATGAGAFTYESTTTARTSLGVGEGDSPTLAGLDITGTLTIGDFGTLISETNPDNERAIRLKGTTKSIDVVIGGATGFFNVYNAADDTAVFYVSNEGDVNAGGDLDVVNITASGELLLDVEGNVGRLTLKGSTDTGEIQFGTQTDGDAYMRIIPRLGVNYFEMKDRDFLLESNTKTLVRVNDGTGLWDFKDNDLITTGEINFRDTDISIGSTVEDGVLDMSADGSIRVFYDNADVGDETDGQGFYVYRRAAEFDRYVKMFVDKAGTAMFITDSTNFQFWSGGGLRFNVQSTGVTFYPDLRLRYDNTYFYFGSSKDAKIYYDAANLIIDPDAVGSGVVKIGATADDEIQAGLALFTDKVKFTQTDGNEYIDSLADGYMDYGATTGHRINVGGAYEYTLPVADGSADEIIKTDGSGTLSFVRASKAIYAELSDSADQTFAVAGTHYSITFDTNDEIAGITHSTSVDPENITIDTTGVYTIFAQPQVAAAAGGAGTFHMWLQKDTGGGFVDIANTNIELSLASAKEDVIPLATTFMLSAGDKIRLRVNVSDNGIKLDAQAAIGGPPTEPAIPSIIFTMFMIGT